MCYYRFLYLLLLLLFINNSGLCQDFEYNGLQYTILDEENRTCETKAGHKTMQGLLPSTSGNMIDGDLVISSKVYYGEEEYTVVQIGAYGFYGNNNLRSVVLPSSVSVICGNAFSDCNSLESISLPMNLTK